MKLHPVGFAFAWNRLPHPDFNRLMGSYTGDYSKACSRPHAQKVKGAFRRRQVNSG
jgi:hypothetical protein